ncbi:MAG: NAD-dependent epimerase/dehydratase family protein [Patescibacteria group bacterium]
MSQRLSRYKNKKVIITGGLGFIGSTLAIKLVELGAKVTLIDSLVPNCGGNIFNVNPVKDKVKINISDVRDRESMNYLVQNQDIMFNMAGTLSHIDSMTDPFMDLQINCVAQLSILEACRWHNPNIKIVWAGTRNQYGRAQYLPVDENHPQNPTDINGINEIAGEQYHMLYHRIYSIKSCSLRMTNTFGPRHQMRHPRQGVLNWFIKQLIDNQKITLYYPGTQIRDINYIDDVVEALLLAGISDKSWGEAYNLGGIPMGLKDFVELAIKIYGKGQYQIVPYPKDKQPIEIGDYTANWKKINSHLDWEPSTSLEVGIKQTFKYYLKNKKYYWDNS